MRRTLLVFALALLTAALAVPAASAGTIQVTGTQTPTAVGCVYAMTGDLGPGSGRPGTWTDFSCLTGWADDVLRFHPSGTIQLTGTEVFDGCLGSVCGTLTFEYHAEVRYAPPLYVQLVFGRCQHVITSGTGGFEHATGVITFRDDPVTGCSDYKGHITLGG